MSVKLYGSSYYNEAQVEVAHQTWKLVRNYFGFWERPALAAIVCQIVESSLNGPIWYGDTPTTTSRGAFQQQASWVPPAVANTAQDPRRSLVGGLFLFLNGGYAAGTPGLFAFDWVNLPVGTLVQKVQGSNTPDAYTNKLADAQALLSYVETLP